MRNALSILWHIGFAVMALGYVAGQARDGHFVSLAITAVLLGLVAAFRARYAAGRPFLVIGADAGEDVALLRELPAADRMAVVQLAVSGREIEAIGLLRRLRPVGLRDAKAAVDQVAGLGRCGVLKR